MAKTTRDYTVGYGKPPAEHQFKPGKSGNPKGREPKSKSMKQTLLEQSDKAVVVKQNGAATKVSKHHAIVLALFQKAMQGESWAIRQYFQLWEKYKLDMPPLPDVSSSQKTVTIPWDDKIEADFAEIDRKFRLLVAK
jgi:hypothetical protein